MSDTEPTPDEVVPEPELPSAAPAAVRIRSSAWVFVTQVGKTALSIPLGILLARTLGAEGKGAVSVVQTITGVVCMLGALGMPNAIMWLAAKGRATARGSLALASVFAAAATGLIGGLAIIVGPEAAAARLGLDSGLLLVLAVVAIVPSMISLFTAFYLLGRGSIRVNSMIDVASPAIQLLVMAALALSGRLTVLGAVLVWLIGNVLVAALRAVFALRATATGGLGAAGIWRAGRAFALKSWLGDAVTLLSLRQDLLILAALAGTREVGIYSIAVTAAELAWYVPNALQTVATVKFAAGGESTELVERMNRSIWPFTLVCAAAIFVLAAPLIPLVYGGQFQASVLPLAALLPGIVVMSMSTSLSAWLTGRGHPQEPALANVANMGVNLVANFILIPRLGAAGAALASTISYTVASSVIVWRFRARTGARIVDILVPRSADLSMMWSVAKSALLERLGRRAGDTPQV